MKQIDITGIVDLLAEQAIPISDDRDLDPLIDQIGDAKIVMLGEASHGTHEYYVWRSHISRRLIQEKGFRFIAVEGDWPDCYQLNRYIKGYTDDDGASAALRGFARWPSWMWANWEVAALAEWLRSHNKGLPADKRAGFYGLDVYSLWESMEAILEYLEKTDPATAETARQAYRCFEPYGGEDGYNYASALRFAPELCEKQVTELLTQIQLRRPQYDHDHEAAFNIEQNAHVAVNAEAYYRAMLTGSAESWNARDRHMQDTLERLLDFHGAGSKAIVWAHNTHIGDAYYTDMRLDNMFNIGQLSRETFGAANVMLVGFGSYSGSVIAGRSWGAAMEVMPVPDARNGSWEDLLHRAEEKDYLLLKNTLQAYPLADENLPHRAIGVVYQPRLDTFANYVPSFIGKRYDAFLFFHKTRALHPLPAPDLDKQEVPETYPFGV